MDFGWTMLCAYLWMSQASKFLVLRRPEPLRFSLEKEVRGVRGHFPDRVALEK